jgi:hypothetical protein
MLLPFRFNAREKVRFLFSSPRDKVHQEGVKGITVQLVYPSKGLLHGHYIRLDFYLGFDPVGLFFEDACPYVMGSHSEHNRISKSSMIAGSSQGESRRRGCRY